MFSRPRDHPQESGFSASRWADKNEELAIGDVQIHIANGTESVGVNLRDSRQSQPGHGYTPDCSRITMTGSIT